MIDSVADRLEKYRIPVTESGCLLWTASTVMGYGCLRVKKKTQLVHRLVWARTYGPIPDGMHVLHKCDVRLCSNPQHLFIGTNADNIQDSVRKGRRKGLPRRRPKGLTYKPWTEERKERQRALTKEQIEYVISRRQEGDTLRKLAVELGVNSATIYNWSRAK